MQPAMRCKPEYHLKLRSIWEGCAFGASYVWSPTMKSSLSDPSGRDIYQRVAHGSNIARGLLLCDVATFLNVGYLQLLLCVRPFAFPDPIVPPHILEISML